MVHQVVAGLGTFLDRAFLLGRRVLVVPFAGYLGSRRTD